MKYKRLSPLMLSLLSTALMSLGFGSCRSKNGLDNELVQQEIGRRHARLDSEIAQKAAQLARMRSDYENIGRGECVYGGPNTMREAIAAMEKRQAEQRKEMEKAMQSVSNEIDSLQNEQQRVPENVLNEFGKNKK